jgi:ferredoxin
MIVVKQKEIDWILDRLDGAARVVVMGCGACAAVCFGGGEREVEEVCCALQLARAGGDAAIEFEGLTCKRACDWEFVEPVADTLRAADVVVSLACGAGTNLLAEQLAETRVLPGVDTVFLGTSTGPESWNERCAACGDCILDMTFGLCPVAGCAKTLLNGPCGGSNEGKCEVNPETDCVWAKIVDKARALGRLEELEAVVPPKDWSSARHGGQRSLNRADLGLHRLTMEELDEI